MTTAAVILAAGGGSRFAAGDKLLAPFRGRPLVVSAVEAALAATIDEVIVVEGHTHLDGVLPTGVALVHNPEWATGIASSLQIGLRAADHSGCDAVVVGLGDQPLVPTSAWSAVAASPSPIAVATYEGHRRNPVRLARQVWALLPATGDEGARALMRAQPGLVAEVPCEGNPTDVDTVGDLNALG